MKRFCAIVMVVAGVPLGAQERAVEMVEWHYVGADQPTSMRRTSVGSRLPGSGSRGSGRTQSMGPSEPSPPGELNPGFAGDLSGP